MDYPEQDLVVVQKGRLLFVVEIAHTFKAVNHVIWAFINDFPLKLMHRRL